VASTPSRTPRTKIKTPATIARGLILDEESEAKGNSQGLKRDLPKDYPRGTFELISQGISRMIAI